MRKILLIIAVGVVVGCGKKKSPEPQRNAPSTPKAEVENTDSTKVVPEKLITDPFVEREIRRQLGAFGQPEGELTMAYLEKVKSMDLTGSMRFGYEITDASLKEVSKLHHLTQLHLRGTNITDEGLKEVVKLKQLKELYLPLQHACSHELPEALKILQAHSHLLIRQLYSLQNF